MCYASDNKLLLTVVKKCKIHYFYAEIWLAWESYIRDKKARKKNIAHLYVITGATADENRFVIYRIAHNNTNIMGPLIDLAKDLTRELPFLMQCTRFFSGVMSRSCKPSIYSWKTRIPLM